MDYTASYVTDSTLSTSWSVYDPVFYTRLICSYLHTLALTNQPRTMSDFNYRLMKMDNHWTMQYFLEHNLATPNTMINSNLMVPVV